MESKKIIIVDDHQLISAGIRSLIGHMDTSVELIGCSNAREALQLISEPVRYDLLLIDINMPSFSGIDLLTAIKSRKVSTPAAMISGTSDIPTIQKCLNAGAVGFIPKTASPALIVKGLGTLLRGQHFIPPHLENYVFFNSLHCNSQIGSEELLSLIHI